MAQLNDVAFQRDRNFRRNLTGGLTLLFLLAANIPWNAIGIAAGQSMPIAFVYLWACGYGLGGALEQPYDVLKWLAFLKVVLIPIFGFLGWLELLRGDGKQRLAMFFPFAAIVLSLWMWLPATHIVYVNFYLWILCLVSLTGGATWDWLVVQNYQQPLEPRMSDSATRIDS